MSTEPPPVRDDNGKLQQFADSVAVRVAGPAPDDANSEFGIDWTVLADLIEQIILAIAQDCPANDARIVRAVKRPRRRQRTKFKAQVFRHCNQCATYRWRQESGNIAEQMMAEMQDMPDADVLSVVFEARHDDWILV